jgi:uncharacterized protein YndB with AHSA1/START domain
MAAYYTSQAYDAPAALIWSILTDFPSWPRWFPRVSTVRLENGSSPQHGARLIAVGEDPGVWTRWQIVDWQAPTRLVCEHVDSNAPMTSQVQAAYLQFELFEEPEGCTLEVEIAAEGYGVVGDFFVGMTLGSGVRRLLPELVDAFSDHVVERVAGRT